MTPVFILLFLVSVERIGELWLARRNTVALMSARAVEVAPGHYPAIVLLHAAWLCGLWLLARDEPIAPVWLGVFLVLQVMRAWVLLTLGRRWTTRIIVPPGGGIVRGGPYRYFSHPNYLVVIGEFAVLPLCFGLWEYAVLFSAVNAVVLTIRIRAESAALAHASGGAGA